MTKEELKKKNAELKKMTEECTDTQKQDNELKEFTEEFEKKVEREKARVLRNLDKYWR